MIRKLSFGILGLFLVSSLAWGAPLNLPQIRNQNTEMRKSVVWVMAGLQALDQSKDHNLRLQPHQKQKILSIFNSLVSKKIILLKSEPNQRNNGERGQSGANLDPNDPKTQERLKALQEQTAFGNRQVDLIDGILTPKQSGFIDNLNFQADQYGFFTYQNSGQSGGQGQGQFQGTNPQQMAKLRQQIRTGRANQVKLFQNVAKLLKAK